MAGKYERGRRMSVNACPMSRPFRVKDTVPPSRSKAHPITSPAAQASPYGAPAAMQACQVSSKVASGDIGWAMAAASELLQQQV